MKMFTIIAISFFAFSPRYASANVATMTTQRFAQLSNDRVNVWETVIYPAKSNILKMHRHDYDRVLVALDDGELKITTDKAKVYYLKLAKNKSYYLTKDIPNELHTDENMTNHPIKVMVIELKN